MQKRKSEDVPGDNVSRKQSKSSQIKPRSSKSGEQSQAIAVYVLLYTRMSGYNGDEAEIKGVFTDLEAANNAAVTVYKKTCDIWGEQSIYDLGITEDNNPGADINQTYKSYNSAGGVRYVWDEESAGTTSVSVQKHNVQDASAAAGNRDRDSDLPYHNSDDDGDGED